MHSASQPQASALTEPCRYCSIVSQANGEKPIGTAVNAESWLFIEVPHPWAKNPWQSTTLTRVFKEIEKRPRLWAKLSIVAIASDKTLSLPDSRHVFYYQQPPQFIAEYQQQHYLVPEANLERLLEALILKPQQQEHFQRYRQLPSRNLFVCTHTHYDVACGRFGTPLFKTLRQDFAKSGQLNIWQSAHFGGHNFAPTLIDFPRGQFWGHLNSEILDLLIKRKGDVSPLLGYYRGWSGCSLWEQVAEQDLWRQLGNRWLEQPTSVRT
ncbi:MAG: sucrase ferredoxin, partial [Cyanobacteria bacterium P01_H01_bin.15]